MEHYEHHFHLKPTPTPGPGQKLRGFEETLRPHDGHIDFRAKIWMSVAVIYTVGICMGMTVLFFQRFTQAVRLRGFWLTCLSVLALHAYLSCLLISYPVRFWWTCSSEYWVMSTVFPLGIGLYQMSNARFIYFYQTQQELLTKPRGIVRRKMPSPFKNPWAFIKHWKNINFLVKMQFFIALTWLATVVFSTVLFLGSRNFHADYGFFGEWTGPQNCHRGPHGEWVPAAMCQLLMCWCWGPYMLFCSRKVDDSHFWSLQTKVNLIAGLPGTPLWLTFLYSNHPTIIAINRWFPHAGWFIPGIVTIQLGSIVFPLLDICKAHEYVLNLDGESTADSPQTSSGPSHRKLHKEMYTVAAFEGVMDKCPERLLKWAADCNFTAADVRFLLYVQKWKDNWGGPGRRTRTLSRSQCRSRYEDAAVIFFIFISGETSPVAINLNGRVYNNLAKNFTDLTYDVDGEGTGRFTGKHQITPWENASHASQIQRMPSLDKGRLHRVGVSGDDDVSDDEDDYPIPSGFSLSVFDDACAVIREDVFYNTWMRYAAHIVSTKGTGKNGPVIDSPEGGTTTPAEPPQAHMAAPRS